MTIDQKIDEVLEVVREHSAQFQKQGAQINELFQLFLEERQLNNSRFTQLATGLMDLKKDVDAGFTSVNGKVDQVRESLSSDINAFYEDLQETKRRVTRVEKKLHS